MTRLWWTCSLALVLIVAAERPAFACSCAAVHSFQQRLQAAPLVVVGRVALVGEVPHQPETAPDVTIVRPPSWGAGVSLAIISVAKGEFSGREIRVWDVSYGSCGNALYGLTIGTTVLVGLWPVADTPATERRTWGAASFIPESDYFARGACGESVQVLNSEDAIAWNGRKIPATPAGALDRRLPSARVRGLP